MIIINSFLKNMKTTTFTLIFTSMSIAFLCSYFMELTASNMEQYLAVASVVFADGFFGVIAGTKREGFKTYKALKILKSLFFWIIMLTVILTIEKGFEGTSWLSETLITPFLVFQLISVLKNANMSGFITNELLTKLMQKIDQHKH